MRKNLQCFGVCFVSGKSLQEAALETLKDELQHQQKIAPRKPIESLKKPSEKNINYTRGSTHAAHTRCSQVMINVIETNQSVCVQVFIDHNPCTGAVATKTRKHLRPVATQTRS